MNSGAAGKGWGCWRPDDPRNHQAAHQASSAIGWQYDIRCQTPGTKRRPPPCDPYLSPPLKKRSIALPQNFSDLIKPERFHALKRQSDQTGYDGKSHSQYATSVKHYTSDCRRPLNHREQNQLIPWLQTFQPATNWSWRSLTTITHSFTSAGVFTLWQLTGQPVKDTQASLLAELLDAVLHKCRPRPENSTDIEVWGITNLLWAMAKLIENGQQWTPQLEETVAALMPHVSARQNQFTPRGIANVLWAMAKLMHNGQKSTPEFKETSTALLPRVKALKDQFNALDIANLCWAIARLGDDDQLLTPDQTETVAALLPCVKRLLADFKPQEIVNLLWAVGRLVDNGLPLSPELKEVVVTLLPPACALPDHFIPQQIINPVWAMAKLVDNGQTVIPEIRKALATLLPGVNVLKNQFNNQEIANLLWAMAKLVEHGQPLTPEIKEAVAAVLPRVKVMHGQFIPRQIANLLWAVTKLADNGHEQTPEFQEVLATLLPRVITLMDQFNAQGIASLLWTMTKLLDNGQPLTPVMKEAVATLLSRGIRRKVRFNVQNIANLLWSIAKLVDIGYEPIPELKESVVALLPHVKAKKNRFIPRQIANLLWAMAKLVDNGYEMAQQFKEAVAALLPQVKVMKGQQNTQDITTLLWAIAKLVDCCQRLTPELKTTVATLLPHVIAMKDHFNPQELAKLLWAVGSLGDLINSGVTATVAESLPCEANKYPQFTQQELFISLWGLLACNARLYLNKNTNNKNTLLEYQIKALFNHLENAFINDEQEKSIMILAARWLERECPTGPHYQTTSSTCQSLFHAQLQSARPSLKIEQEKSLHALPPVDLFLPEYNIVIEIQGPFHYIGHDFQTRNGSTLLKIALLQRAGYDVIEIPVNQLQNPDSVQSHIVQIQQKITRRTVDDSLLSMSPELQSETG